MSLISGVERIDLRCPVGTALPARMRRWLLLAGYVMIAVIHTACTEQRERRSTADLAPNAGAPRDQAMLSPPGELLTVEVTGDDFNWHIRYPGQDGQLGTSDDILTRRHLHLPTQTDVVLQLKSNDFVYSLALPDWRLKEIAVPELEFSLQFRTGDRGTYQLKGDQMCGYAHPNLLGNMVVLGEDDFQAWLREQPPHR